MAQANLKAVITADDRASGVIGGVGNSFGRLTAAFAAGQLAANAISKALDVVTTAVKDSVGASFKQVGAVENATIALRAYEKNGDKVNKVLKDLIAYARSDMGVLFQREDLFAAAQTLKLYGQSTDTLTDKVKILSKGVSLGKTTFQELSSIVGRAAAKGRLDAVDFDMLIERGIGLDKSMRGAAITSEELFKALDKALPAELLKGRANTIDGMMIRLKSSFRDLGGAILGVDKNTSKFIKGGLGDMFINGLGKLRNGLKKITPTIQKSFKIITGSLKLLTTGDFDGGIFNGVLTEDSKAVDIILKVRDAIIGAFKYMKDNAVKFGRAMKQAFDFLKPSLDALWTTIKENLFPALQRLWRELIEPLIPIIGVVLVGAIWVVINSINLWYKALSFIIQIGLNVKKFFFETLPNALTKAFDFIVKKAIYLKDNFWEVIGRVIGFFATLPFKLPIFVVKAFAKIVSFIMSFKWSKIFSGIWQAMQSVWDKITGIVVKAWHFIHDLKWGDIMKGVGKGIANAIIGLIEGAINGAISGIPGVGDVHLPRFAAGVRDFRGGSAIVGENGPERVYLPKGASVMPHSMSGGGQINITVQAGAFMGNKQDARKYAQMILDNLKDVAQSNGMSLGQMIG